MRRATFLVAVAIAAQGLGTGPAQARESGAGDDAPAASVDQWMAGLSGGINRPDGGVAAPFVQAGLTRRVGRGYVRLAGTAYRSAQARTSAFPTSTYRLASLAAGGTFGGWIVEAQGTLGQQRQAALATRPAARGLQDGTRGTLLWGLGGSIGRNIALARMLGRGWVLTPTVSGSFVQSRLAVAPFGPTQAMPAWSGGLHLRVDRTIDARFESTVGAFVSGRWTSNAAVSLQPGSPGGAAGAGGGIATGTLGEASGGGIVPGAGLSANRVADSWVELGLAANIGLSRHVWIDAFATRSLGQVSGQSSALGLGLRRTF